MSSIDTNTVFLTGCLGADPELKHSASGAPYVRLSMAVHKPSKEKDGGTQWYRVMVWGQQAELCSRILNKGSRLLVEGHLDSYNYENNGAKKTVVQVVGQRVQFLGSRHRQTQMEKDLDLSALEHAADMTPEAAALI